MRSSARQDGQFNFRAVVVGAIAALDGHRRKRVGFDARAKASAAVGALNASSQELHPDLQATPADGAALHNEGLGHFGISFYRGGIPVDATQHKIIDR